MRPYTSCRSKRTLGCILVILLILKVCHPRLSFDPQVSFLQDDEWPCESAAFPPIHETSTEVSEQWDQLQDIFEAHPPNLDLNYHPFEAGKVITRSARVLADYLGMSIPEAMIMRNEHTAVVKSLPNHPVGAFAGRGIVILAGGKYSEIAATTLGMIRLLGSRLPVEVWMIDPIEEKEGWCEELSSQGVACRFVSDYLSDMSAFSHHYQLKIPAIMFSSFEEVLYLDADSLPVINPDHVFDAPAYMNTGAVLWPDYWFATESPFTPFITGQAPRKSNTVPHFKTAESGQMLWNKEKHWKSLCLSAYYNYFGPTYFYTLFTQGGPGWGDKDTFPTALRALKANWTMISHHLETQYYNDGTGHGMGTGMAMMQADPTHESKFMPLFLHSNFIKLSVRRLMCGECAEDISALSTEQRLKEEEVTFKGSISNHKSNIWEQLNYGDRIFATKTQDGLNNMGNLDTEKDIWRVMERVACVGVFSEEDICHRTRRHIDRTFGVVSRWEGGSERMCS